MVRLFSYCIVGSQKDSFIEVNLRSFFQIIYFNTDMFVVSSVDVDHAFLLSDWWNYFVNARINFNINERASS